MNARILAIAHCVEMMTWAIEMQNEHRALIAVVGELDWYFELHDLLYEEVKIMPQQTEDFICAYCAAACRVTRLLSLELYLEHLDVAHPEEAQLPTSLLVLFERDASWHERWRRHRERHHYVHHTFPARLAIAWGKPQPLTRTS